MSSLVEKASVFKLRGWSTEAEAFGRLGEIYAFASESRALKVLVDCSEVRWIDAHLAAGIVAVHRLLLTASKPGLTFSGLQPDTRQILGCTGLFGPDQILPRRSVIPLKHFNPGDSVVFAQFTQEQFSKMSIPKMSDALTEKFFEGIDELFSNAELHSRTTCGMLACGQYFNKRKRLNFSIVDMGIGFQEVILRNLNRPMSPSEAIHWAMQDKNTTRTGDIPGGLGLKILKGLIRLNGGRLSVSSHQGYWCMEGASVVKQDMRNRFPGTAITLELNTADKRSYHLQP